MGIMTYRELDNIKDIYEKARANIKKELELKGAACKGSAKGVALSEIIAVMDQELEIGMAQEIETAKRRAHEYCQKYENMERIERRAYEAQEKIKETEKVLSLVDSITDETLKNAVLAYNAIKDTSRDSHNALQIALAYIKHNGRTDLEKALEGVVQK